ncbi:thymidine phosphorylase [Natranaerovirga pectinivora]|uniref:Pyrimidine-nucleoside phosphorylase n=1 Tax=Natranaerovirga pectinivora TaxID=682400 RepID=A0A4R3MR16_9FIRM|nr:pyrimidine-nucleoside phosphorylase [Natranaerovirga pectinivora]TCT15018.1 thymidine phosphorylase [Natranaerovirga pectinivora]
MRMYDLIIKKRNGETLLDEEIKFIIEGYTKGLIPDYQVSAFLMAIYFNGMNEEETVALTMAMAESGEQLDLSEITGIKADKHSTGGVGDKTSLILGPMVAALGIPVAKMSGRGLGHTGGTIDKLESIQGFNTALSKDEFINNVNNIKIAIAGQTTDIAPADKKLYALRDVTATVDNLSLIASSIMSKKIASGAEVIVLDVKTGNGAFMKNEEDAFKLAEAMVKIGNAVGRQTYAIISDMNQPLGRAVGNALEVIEAIQTLKGMGDKSLEALCIHLGSYMLKGVKHVETIEEGKQLLMKTIEDGSAIRKFKEFIKGQNGEEEVVDNVDLFPKAKFIESIHSVVEGFVNEIKTEQIGIATLILGGGRETKESDIDLSVGFIINKKIGDYVAEGESVGTIYANDRNKLEEAKEKFIKAYVIKKEQPKMNKLIKGYVTRDGIFKF